MIVNLRTGFLISDSTLLSLTEFYGGGADLSTSGTVALDQKKPSMSASGVTTSTKATLSLSQKKPSASLTGVTTDIKALIGISQKKNSVTISGITTTVDGSIVISQKKQSTNIDASNFNQWRGNEYFCSSGGCFAAAWAWGKA